MDVFKIAKVCHEVNKAYCESQGDFSQLHWEDAPQWQRESAVIGVNYAISNPDAKPEDSHACWLAVKIADGWVYGEVKDQDAKTHPCIMPYEDLPNEQKAKDYIFQAVARTLYMMGD